jgi:hypothetical protein
MAQKKTRQTFQKMQREQALKERRAQKQERRAAARLAKAPDAGADEPADHEGADPEPRL